MTTKVKKIGGPAKAPADPKEPEKRTANTLNITGDGSKSRERLVAEALLSPVTANALTARCFAEGGMGKMDFTEMVAVMTSQAVKVKSGDLSAVETTLTAQATALNTIFAELSRRAALNMGEYLPAMETYLRLALKAQAQCRATLQTLAEIKNPRPVAFVKQANIANGPQ